LCDNMAVVENAGYDDKAWTDKLYDANGEKSRRNIFPDINDTETFGFWNKTLPGDYGKVDEQRNFAQRNYVQSASCMYNSTEGSNLASNNIIVNPVVRTDITTEDIDFTICPNISESDSLIEYEPDDEHQWIQDSTKSYMRFEIEGSNYDFDNNPGEIASILHSMRERYENYSILEAANQTDEHRLDEPWDRLQTLFAKVYGVRSWEPIVDPDDENEFKRDRYFQYEDDSSFEAQRDESYDIVVGQGYNTVPVVAGFSLDASGIYKIVPNTINVKTGYETRSSGPIRGYDGQFLIQLQFFAWSDDDHMPIQRVSVDWGDYDEPLYGPDGQYKNYRPICARGNDQEISFCAGTGTVNEETCASDADCSVGSCDEANARISFGAVPRACAETYFQKEYVYVCLPGGANFEEDPAPECPGGYEDNYDLVPVDGCWDPEFEGGACVFRPGAQILDNWGWCNGDCAGEGTGCFNDNIIDENGLIVTEGGRCSPIDLSFFDPFTRYNGFIRITP